MVVGCYTFERLMSAFERTVVFPMAHCPGPTASPPVPSTPGSRGYEEVDAQTFAEWGELACHALCILHSATRWHGCPLPHSWLGHSSILCLPHVLLTLVPGVDYLKYDNCFAPASDWIIDRCEERAWRLGWVAVGRARCHPASWKALDTLHPCPLSSWLPACRCGECPSRGAAACRAPGWVVS